MKSFNIVESFLTTESSLDDLEVQVVDDGMGDLYKKTFTIPIQVNFNKLQHHFKDFKSDMNKYSKNPIAKLPDKSICKSGLEEGNRILIELLGPYNGPVVVTESSENNLKLQTLENHPKAGYIEFSITKSATVPHFFRVDTYSRSKDYLFHLARSKTQVVSKIQDTVWIDLCIHFKSIVEQIEVSNISKDIVLKDFRTITHVDFPKK